MIDLQIQGSLLTLFYKARFSETEDRSYELTLDPVDFGVSEKELGNCLHTMRQLGTLTVNQRLAPCEEIIDGEIRKFAGAVQYFCISPQGITEIESNPQDSSLNPIISKNIKIRKAILEAATRNRTKNGIAGKTGHWEAVQHGYFDEIEATKIEWPLIREQAIILVYQKLLTKGGLCSGYEITPEGLVQLEVWRRRAKTSEEFRALKSCIGMTPQQRGRRLEHVLSIAIAGGGWRCEPNVAVATEEHDLVISKEREYYIAECKWEKKAIGCPHISRLRDKVALRPAGRGLFFSMSHFADTAIQTILNGLNNSLLLLFGPKDIETIIAEDRQFCELLNEKYDNAIKARQILIDGNVHRQGFPLIK